MIISPSYEKNTTSEMLKFSVQYMHIIVHTIIYSIDFQYYIQYSCKYVNIVIMPMSIFKSITIEHSTIWDFTFASEL